MKTLFVLIFLAAGGYCAFWWWIVDSSQELDENMDQVRENFRDFGLDEIDYGPDVRLPALQGGKLRRHQVSVAAAYRAIPHERTPFSFQETFLHAQDSVALRKLFKITDMIVVERVVQMHRLAKNQPADVYNYTLLCHALDRLKVPDHLDPIRRHILAAAVDQHDYFVMSRPGAKFDPDHRLIQSSSEHLKTAYELLEMTYPQEKTSNRKAFFNHLCAMDFI